jgi:NADH dehydrogenase
VNPTRTIAVTGASGYVGSLIVDALSQDHRIVELIRKPCSPGQIAWSFGDAPEPLAHALREQQVDHLIHAAWDMTHRSASALEDRCVAGSARLLQACASVGVERLTFISTISAFADARSAYGRSKFMVERLFLEAGGTVLRLGLVHGEREGGMFGRLRRTARTGIFAPLIGPGSPQYLLHQQTLAAAIASAVRGAFDGETRPITLAHPQPIPLPHLLSSLAAAEGRRLLFVPTPWRVLYGLLRALETLGLNLGVRSDSVLGLVHANARPDFEPMRAHGIEPVPFTPGGRGPTP